MSSYNMIANVGNTIAEVLKKSLVPDVIQNENFIGLCSPNDKGDFILGIYLYNIEENRDMRMNSYISNGTDVQVKPPIFLNLYYMITPYSQSDVRFKSYENQILLGKVIQTLNDYSTIIDKFGNKLNVNMINLTDDQKRNILNSFQNSANSNVSIFYRVSPVQIESTNVRQVVRVKDVDLSIDNQIEY